MTRLLIVGAGQHGSVVADAALSMREWEQIAFVDDRASELGANLGLPIVGTTADLVKLAREYPAAVVAVGGAVKRLELLHVCRNLGFELPVVAHASAAISPFCSLEAGCVVMAQAAVNPNAKLGSGCIVNTCASVDHDCVLGNGVHLCPGVHLAGEVQVGDRAWIGIGSSVRQGIIIGSDVLVGAGSVVVSNVEPGLTVMGVPARPKSSGQGLKS
jgi:sugar O-acyltransferase (sialic acid O-acetyltransferase NeuD family)